VSTGLLDDTPQRDYALKLRLFNAFAEPELRHAVDTLKLRPGMRVLDAGCGSGEALHWLLDAVQPTGRVVGIDLAAAHIAAARRRSHPGIEILQGDLLSAPLDAESFDLVWCVNTLNHLRDPLAGLRRLAGLVRGNGRVVLGQSSFLPDMYFAWDARLERVVNDAVRRYYRERYALDERDLAAVRSLLGFLRCAGFKNVRVRTLVIERTAPLASTDRAYLLEAIFRHTWGVRLRPYLTEADYTELDRLCDPDRGDFALSRPDFHFLQTFTVAEGAVET
jgi:SAM-dependent methyltransferase